MINPLNIFITIAPLLFYGIWLVAEESLLGSDFAAEKLRGRKLEDFLTLFLLSLLLVIGFLVATWDGAKNPILLGISVGLIFTSQFLRKREKKQGDWRKKVDLQLPGSIQSLALMISSGLSPIRAMELISQRTESELSRELRGVVVAIRAGTPANRAIDSFAENVGTPGTRKFSNSIVIALERGSPLVPVLMSLVRDLRVESKNDLLRRAGKAEIALMIPVVFLILPISVVFALFPSITQLQNF